MFRKIRYLQLFKLCRRRSSTFKSTFYYCTQVNGAPSKEGKGIAPAPSQVIPKRISRGPTDILKALASTVSKDYTVPHYKYHDDPFLIPASNLAKRTYALAEESGRRAARYFLENYPECFANNPSDPVIEDFLPPKIYISTSEVTIDDLHHCIETNRVTNAITVYENLMKKGETVDKATQQSLLELLCFCNCTDPAAEEYVEERWFRQNSLRESRKTWKDAGMSEIIFKSMKDKDSLAYCTMIQGMTKHFQVNRAYLLYQEMQGKRLPANAETYNGLLSIVPYLRESSEPRWVLIQELLAAMNKEGIRPNVRTFNTVLDVISKFGSWHPAKSVALKVLVEMRRLGIEPSLATYYYLLLIFCRDRGPPSPILYEIMDLIQDKTFTIQDPKDVFFFVTAMDVCHSHVMDKQLAYRVHNLFQKNQALIGDSYKESIYYQHLFKLICSTESIDIFFEFYNKYVPNVYTPEPSVMYEIIQAIEISDALNYLPQIWSDVIVFDQVGRERIVTEILAIMARSKPPAELQSKFLNIAWDILEQVDAQASSNRMRAHVQWTGSMLENIVTICMNAEKLDKAWFVMYKLRTERDNIIGVPSEKCIEKFFQACLESNYPDRAVFCLQYALEIGYSNIALFMRNNTDKYLMSEALRNKLKSIVECISLDNPNNNGEKKETRTVPPTDR